MQVRAHRVLVAGGGTPFPAPSCPELSAQFAAAFLLGRRGAAAPAADSGSRDVLLKLLLELFFVLLVGFEAVDHRAKAQAR